MKNKLGLSYDRLNSLPIAGEVNMKGKSVTRNTFITAPDRAHI